MAPIVVAIMLGAGVAAWVYNKSMRRTGNNTQSSSIAAAASGIIAFLVMLVTLSLVNSILSD